MRFRINVERQRQPLIPSESRALVVTAQSLLAVAFTCLGCVTLDFLLEMLAFARDEHLILTWLVLATG